MSAFGHRVGFAARYRGVMVENAQQPSVEVRRSNRRTRTVSAYREGDTIVVLVPARLTRTEEQKWIDTMVAKLARSEQRRRPDDDALAARAEQLSMRYLEGRAIPASVRWVTNQNRRWGSCSTLDRTIRLSSRLQGMPPYVIDYVLMHELAHLLVPGHNDEFWRWVDRFAMSERAKGFLEGMSAASRSAGSFDDDVDSPGTAAL